MSEGDDVAQASWTRSGDLRPARRAVRRPTGRGLTPGIGDDPDPAGSILGTIVERLDAIERAISTPGGVATPASSPQAKGRSPRAPSQKVSALDRLRRRRDG